MTTFISKQSSFDVLHDRGFDNGFIALLEVKNIRGAKESSPMLARHISYGLGRLVRK